MSKEKVIIVQTGVKSQEQIPLTIIDETLMRWGHTPQVWFYKNTLDESLLMDSLTNTLKNFPVLTGSLITKDGKSHVVCNDKGAKIEIVNSDAKFFLIIRITQMVGGGTALGTKIFHGVADGFSSNYFMQCWSKEAASLKRAKNFFDELKGKKETPNPSFDRSWLLSLEDNWDKLDVSGDLRQKFDTFILSPIEFLKTNAFLIYDFITLPAVTLTFTVKELEKMKAEASKDLPKGEWISTSHALSAHLWRHITLLRIEKKTIESSNSSIYTVANVRNQFAKQLPTNYFGNATSTKIIYKPIDELLNSPLSTIALSVKSMYNIPEETFSDSCSFNRYVKEKKQSTWALPKMLAQPPTFMVNDHSKFPQYEYDFGSEKPFWYDIPTKAVRYFCDIMGKSDGTRELHISLPKDELELFKSPHWQSKLHCFAE